ncbi:UUP1 family membrane protein [Vibrio lentus]|nr:UUP1 family membrane protein [Vibrio lentus]
MGESASSPGYGISYLNTDFSRRAEWSIRHADGHRLSTTRHSFSR